MSFARRAGIAVAVLLLVAAAVALWPEPPPAAPSASPEAAPRADAPAAPAREPLGAAEPAAPAPAPDAAPALPPGLASVDLAAVRAALPDNLYWQNAAPTDDPAVLEAREREAAFRNEQYGKVLSGTGTDEEILDYFAYRQRASTDYIQFVDHLLERYGSDLSDQDLTLLHLAKRLHGARLEEIPRRLQEARERKAAQDEARRRWLEEEREFSGETDPAASD
jgi:hypothetical protein